MISLVIPMYVSKEIPMYSLLHYNSIAKSEHVQVIVVDDGSPIKVHYGIYPYIKFIRIDENIKWNQPAASNLGVKHSVFKYILRTDIDAIISDTTIEYVKNNLPRRGEVLKFKRFHNGKEILPHPNVFVIHKNDYGGGYDESFCGQYGHDDKHFFAIRKLKEKVINQYILSIDLNSHDLSRDRKVNEQKFIKKLSNANQS